jgi:hypothetical protein
MNRSRLMKFGILVLALVICLPGLALAQTGGGGGNGNGNGNSGSVNGRGGNSTFRQNNPMPVLIYTVWGLDDDSGSGSSSGVGSGSSVSSLVLYDNGLATWNQSNADGSSTSGCSGNCVNSVQLSGSQVNDFIASLRRAGAFRQVSNNSNNATDEDSSLTTITVFRYIQGSVSTANTFSFFSSGANTGRLGGIQNAFSQFFTTNFGTDGTGSGGNGGSGSGGGS